MTRIRFAALVVTVLVLCRSSGADLPADVRAVLKNPYLSKAAVGVAIARLDGSNEPDFVFRSNAATPLVPASNLKIVTTAAALDLLGAEFRFRTMLIQKGEDLCILGDGDPTFGDVELLKKAGWSVDSVFNLWAEELKKRNITTIRHVYVDDSVFDEVFLNPNWPADQEHKRYVAQVGGLNLNVNCVDFYIRTSRPGQLASYTMEPPTNYLAVGNTCVTGTRDAVWLSRQRGGNDVILRGEIEISRDAPVSVTVHDPPMFAGTVLAETLARNGIEITGQVLRDRTVRSQTGMSVPSGWSLVAALETQIASVLARANKDSMNLYAEALCKRLGFEATAQSGSWESGTAAMAQFLRDCGVPEDQFKIDDGCGLSKENAISAEAIVRVLAAQHAGHNAELFRKSLAISGVDGTLDYRFRDSDLRGRVFGKSGYVNNVSALSGYINTRDGAWHAFSIIMNDVPYKTNNTAKELQERIVKAIDDGVKDEG